MIRPVIVTKYETLDGVQHDSAEAAQRYWDQKKVDVRRKGVRDFFDKMCGCNRSFETVAMANTAFSSAEVNAIITDVVVNNWNTLKNAMRLDKGN